MLEGYRGRQRFSSTDWLSGQDWCRDWRGLDGSWRRTHRLSLRTDRDWVVPTREGRATIHLVSAETESGWVSKRGSLIKRRHLRLELPELRSVFAYGHTRDLWTYCTVTHRTMNVSPYLHLGLSPLDVKGTMLEPKKSSSVAPWAVPSYVVDIGDHTRETRN